MVQRFLAAGLAALMTTWAPSLPQTASAVEEPHHQLRVITHNIEGGAIDQQVDAQLDVVYEQIQSFRPDVVMLQEVCDNQSADFADTLGPGWTVEFTPMVQVQACEDDGNLEWKGQVLASPHPMTNIEVYDLWWAQPPQPHTNHWNGRNFNLTCADIDVPSPVFIKPLRACNTHLVMVHADDPAPNADEKRDDQVININQAINPFLDQGRIAVVGGDLNAGPQRPALDRLYRKSNTGGTTTYGQYREGDETDPRMSHTPRNMELTTRNGKLDYIFYNYQACDPASLSAGLVENPESDHKLKRAYCDVGARWWYR